MKYAPLMPLLFVGGHPAVGKSELSRVVAEMFTNVEVVELRELMRKAGAEEGLKSIKTTTGQQLGLMRSVNKELDGLRKDKVVVLLGHFVHPQKVRKIRAAGSEKVEVLHDQFVSYVRELPLTGLVHLDARPEEIILRASKRREELGVGEHFLTEHASTRELVQRRRLAEAVEARKLASDKNIRLQQIRVDLQNISRVQKRLFSIVSNYGGNPKPFWKIAMSGPWGGTERGRRE